MVDWWNALTIELQIFYGIGILSLFFTIIQAVLAVVGMDGGEAVDLDLDIADVDHSTGIGLFSSQTIAAFFLGFGWGGVLFFKAGLHPILATFLAFNVGGLLMVGMYILLVSLMKLQGKGNMDYSSAVGQTAQVYVTIPAERSGRGQIQVMISGRLATVEAVTDNPEPIKYGQSVIVTDQVGNSGFLVELS